MERIDQKASLLRNRELSSMERSFNPEVTE